MKPMEITAENDLNNIEAEMTLVGTILLNNEALYSADRLKIEDFADGILGAIYHESARRIDLGESVSPVLLKTVFGEYKKYLPALVSAGKINARGMPEIVAELKRLAMLRKIKTICAKIEVSDDSDPSEVGSGLVSELQDILDGKASRAPVNDADVTYQILEGMKANEQPVSTGIRKLDQCMGGGLYPRKSYGFAARMKVGKTILAGTISYNLAQAGVKHLFIAGEMGQQEIQERILARHLQKHPFSFRGDHRKDINFQKQIAEAAATSKRCLLYQDAPGLTLQDLKQYVSAAVARHKIKGVILDYWQLVRGKEKGDSDAAHLDKVAQWLADYCRKHGLFSIVMAQINQEGNTRGGEGIKLAFDQVYQIHRPDLSANTAWVEMMATRYTPWCNIGDEHTPGLILHEKGPYFGDNA